MLQIVQAAPVMRLRATNSVKPVYHLQRCWSEAAGETATRAKRKQFLKAKRQRQRIRGKAAGGDDISLADNKPAFGEQALAPPQVGQ